MYNAEGSYGRVFEFEIKTLAGALIVKVDVEDEDKVRTASRWGIYKDRHERKFARSSKKDGQVLLHKLLVDVPKGSTLVWKNGDTLDCRTANLQLVDKDGNVTELARPAPENRDQKARDMANAAILSALAPPVKKQLTASEDFGTLEEQDIKEEPARKTSDVKGVYFHKASKRWTASAFHAGTRYSLGYFDQLEDAEREVTYFRLHGPHWDGLKRNQPRTRQGY